MTHPTHGKAADVSEIFMPIVGTAKNMFAPQALMHHLMALEQTEPPAGRT